MSKMCPMCNKPVPEKSGMGQHTGRKRKYCSLQCSEKARLDKSREWHRSRRNQVGG